MVIRPFFCVVNMMPLWPIPSPLLYHCSVTDMSHRNYRETSIHILYFVFVSLKTRFVFGFRICISLRTSLVLVFLAT